MLNENRIRHDARHCSEACCARPARVVKRAELRQRDGVKMSKEAQRAEVERIERIINGALKSLARLKEAIAEGN
jgi:hypothetical protein